VGTPAVPIFFSIAAISSLIVERRTVESEEIIYRLTVAEYSLRVQ
jgi:hypothetical protein